MRRRERLTAMPLLAQGVVACREHAEARVSHCRAEYETALCAQSATGARRRTWRSSIKRSFSDSAEIGFATLDGGGDGGRRADGGPALTAAACCSYRARA